MTHASPTLFYAGTPCGSLSSCYLNAINDDSIDGIYDTVKDCAVISKAGGGIGIAVSKVRASGAIVRSTGRPANGILPALRVLNETARHVTQGGRRKGAIAIYIEPHHADIFDIVAIRLNHGVESNRCRDLFPALWVSDLFMERVRDDTEWTLFSPDTAPGLDDVWGTTYRDCYSDYEKAGLGIKVVRARELWSAITTAQIETGTPYLLFKDTVNRANAQANIGIIRNSNLCAEITLHVSKEETAVCNLASIALPYFVDADTRTFDFEKLAETVAMTVENLDAIIDRTYNPTPQTETSNARNRPIGIGVQGLADVFMALRMTFDGDEARALNVDIFESMYTAALDASCELARSRGTYPTYAGSPASRGQLQPDLFLAGEYGSSDSRAELRSRIDTPAWRALRAKIAEHGLRHSVLIALMPTASTAQLLGNTEAFEALGSNLFVRRTLAGEFTLINERLVADLSALGKWTKETRDAIMRADGSVQGLAIPDDLKSIYRTVFEVSQRSVCEMAADRAPFIDQTQSLNIHMANATSQKLTSLHFHNHSRGLKTSTYYVRTRAASSAIKFTLDLEQTATDPIAPSGVVCDGDACIMCSA
jgi:ribonucleoside-diphosphate reductase subunit M1